MTFLFPQHFFSAIILGGFVLAEFVSGFWLIRNKFSNFLSWTLPIFSVAGVHFLTAEEPAGFRMIALILVLLTGMKVVTAAAYPRLRFTWFKWTLYCFTWVGMNPEIFFKQRLATDKSLFYRGMVFLASGVTILFLLRFFLSPGSIPTGVSYYLLSLVILIALSMILHFGLLNISAWALQQFGYPAYSLFRAPLSAKSLTDFWGKRWNLAFTEMTSVTVYRPLFKKYSLIVALIVSFAVSGLLHEVALSLPVQSGYGLPLVYFVIQLMLVVAEQKFFIRKPGSVWVIAGLIIPLPLLFHPSIMKAVFWQFVL